MRPSPVKLLAGERGVPVVQPNSLRKEPESVELLKSYGPFDLGIVVAFGQILPIDVLAIPRRGCVNLHASLLPRWRGAAPIQRSIMAGDAMSGVCLMEMEAGLDTGAVYATVRTPIAEEDNGGTLHDRLAILGTELLDRWLIAVIDGTVSSVPQPEHGITYASKVERRDAQILWHLPAEEINRTIRALAPVPGAFSTLDGVRVKIFSAIAIDDFSSMRVEAGMVTFVSSEKVEVACGQGILLLQEIQPEGGKRMSIGEYLRGRALQVGQRFG
jgi:methionyl-tRNA formyltransferase